MAIWMIKQLISTSWNIFCPQPPFAVSIQSNLALTCPAREAFEFIDVLVAETIIL
jgi:hypothetical protein